MNLGALGGAIVLALVVSVAAGHGDKAAESLNYASSGAGNILGGTPLLLWVIIGIIVIFFVLKKEGKK